MLEHKQVSCGQESNKRECLYNKNVIELACSVRIGKILVSSYFFASLLNSPSARSINLQKKVPKQVPNTDLTLVQ